jgi:hypothetical protein
MANRFIENIVSGDSNVYVSTNGYTPFYYPDDKNLHDGSVRTRGGGLEYYDAKYNAWLPLPGCESKIEISPHVQIVLEWAYKKMAEEEKLKVLTEKYPSLKQAKENYDIVKALVQNEVV